MVTYFSGVTREKNLPKDICVTDSWRSGLPKDLELPDSFFINCPERHIFLMFFNDFTLQPTCFLNPYLAGVRLLGLESSLLSAKATFENGVLVLWSSRHFFEITLNFMLVQSPVQQGLNPRTGPIIMTGSQFQWVANQKKTDTKSNCTYSCTIVTAKWWGTWFST